MQKLLVDLIAQTQRLHRELHVWKRLHHPNVTLLYGTISEMGTLSMISPWMEGGNLEGALKTPLSTSDRLKIVRVCRLRSGIQLLRLSRFRCVTLPLGLRTVSGIYECMMWDILWVV